MDYENLLKESWTVLRNNLGVYIAATLIVIFGSIFVVTLAPLAYGYSYIAIKGLRTGKVEINDVFEGFRSNNFIRSWIVTLIGVVVYFAAALIHSLLGVLVTLFLLYAMFLLVMRGCGSIAALQGSIEVVKRNPIESIILFAMIYIINIVGMLALIVGLLIAVPLGEILTARVLFGLIGEEYEDISMEAAELIEMEESGAQLALE